MDKELLHKNLEATCPKNGNLEWSRKVDQVLFRLELVFMGGADLIPCALQNIHPCKKYSAVLSFCHSIQSLGSLNSIPPAVI